MEFWRRHSTCFVLFAASQSNDLDIFVRDPQYFSFLSPRWFIDHQAAFQSEYLEKADHISLATLTGVKVDFLLAPSLTDKPPTLKRVGNVESFSRESEKRKGCEDC
jgi:hypothetical protein